MSEQISFRSLLPAGPAVAASEYVAAAAWRRLAPPHRPHVVANFVESADGHATFDGRSGPLSDPGDRALFHALRGGVDAILAGTGTLAGERYRPAVKPVVTFTRSGRVPTDIPLFAEPEGRVIVFSGTEVDLSGVPADVSVEPLGDPAAAMARLREGYGIEALLCEGGPGLFSSLIHADLLDELCVTLAPKLTGGGDGPAMTVGAELERPGTMTLIGLLEHDSTLFARYRLTHG